MSSLRNSYRQIARNKSSSEFYSEVAVGRVEGVRAWSSSGLVTDLVSDTETDITNLESPIILPSNEGEFMEIVSTDPLDTDTILIEGLDENFDEFEPKIVVLTGTTPVPIEGLISRVNSISSIGDSGFEGTISVRQLGGGDIFISAIERHQRSRQSLYSIPRNKIALVSSLIGTMQKSSGNDTDVAITLKSKSPTQSKWGVSFAFGLQRSGDTSIEFNNSTPDGFTGPLDFKSTANSTSSGSSVLVRISGYIYDLRLDL